MNPYLQSLKCWINWHTNSALTPPSCPLQVICELAFPAWHRGSVSGSAERLQWGHSSTPTQVLWWKRTGGNQMKNIYCVFEIKWLSCLSLIKLLSRSLPSADSVWPGKDWHLWLEVQYPSEALHPWQQHRQVVLESRGVVWRGEEGPAAAVCYRLIQSPAARLQGSTGYLSVSVYGTGLLASVSSLYLFVFYC